MVGPGAIAACEEVASRDVARLKDSLIRTGALSGLQHKFFVRSGEVWPELREIIRLENVDLLVLGTHGRQGVAKLFFGSVAEQIFRQADCPVLTFGRHSYEHPWVDGSARDHTFLFATDFGQSLQGLPHAIATANQFGAKLVLLSIVPSSLESKSSMDTTGNMEELREHMRLRVLSRMKTLVKNASLDISPEFNAEFASSNQVSEKILETAERLHADLIIMGRHESTHPGIGSHLRSATAYEVICGAVSPELTVTSAPADTEIRFRAEAAKLLLSEADLIRIKGLGVKW